MKDMTAPLPVGDTGKMYQTHEGEFYGDFSDASLKVTKYTYLFALCAAINSCNLGYDIGVSANAGVLIERDLGLSDVQRELFVGSLNFWSLFGSLFAHWICDLYGRRQSFKVAAFSFIIGLAIMAAANGYAMLMVGRVFVGLGVGFGLAVSFEKWSGGHSILMNSIAHLLHYRLLGFSRSTHCIFRKFRLQLIVANWLLIAK